MRSPTLACSRSSVTPTRVALSARLRLTSRRRWRSVAEPCDIFLRAFVSELRSFSIELQRLRYVFGQSAASLLVVETEIVDRIGIALIGGLPVQLHGFRFIFRYAVALFVHHAEIVLRGSVPLYDR